MVPRNFGSQHSYSSRFRVGRGGRGNKGVKKNEGPTRLQSRPKKRGSKLLSCVGTIGDGMFNSLPGFKSMGTAGRVMPLRRYRGGSPGAAWRRSKSSWNTAGGAPVQWVPCTLPYSLDPRPKGVPDSSTGHSGGIFKKVKIPLSEGPSKKNVL